MKKKCDVKRCKAGCCGPVPIPNEVLHEYANLIQREITHQIAFDEHSTIVTDQNAVCAFLTPDYRCAIYDHRPQICRMFGSRSHPDLRCRYLKK